MPPALPLPFDAPGSLDSSRIPLNPPTESAVSRWTIAALAGIRFSGWISGTGESRVVGPSLSGPWKPCSVEPGTRSTHELATSTLPG